MIDDKRENQKTWNAVEKYKKYESTQIMANLFSHFQILNITLPGDEIYMLREDIGSSRL